MGRRQAVFSRRLVFVFVAALVVYGAIVIGTYEQVLSSALRGRLLERQERDVTSSVEMFDTIFTTISGVGRFVASDPVVSDFMLSRTVPWSDPDLFLGANQVLEVFANAATLTPELNLLMILLGPNGFSFANWDYGNNSFSNLRLEPGTRPDPAYFGARELRVDLDIRRDGRVLLFQRAISLPGHTPGRLLVGVASDELERQLTMTLGRDAPPVALIHGSEMVVALGDWNGSAAASERRLATPGWSVRMGVSQQDLRNQMADLRPVALPVLVLSIGVTAVVAFVLLRQQVRGLATVEMMAAEIEAGNLSVRARHSAHLAGGTIGTALDRSLDVIQELIQAQAREHEQRLRSELVALSAQIRPHFLLNALHSVRVMAELADDDEIAATVRMLSRILEQTFRIESGEVTLDRELLVCSDTVELANLSRRTAIELLVDVDCDDQRLLIPPLLLQPLVENAIQHGFSADRDGGVIEIRTTRIEGQLVVTVTDDGAGMHPEAPLVGDPAGWFATPYLRTGLGNVFRRITLMWGNDATIRAESANQEDGCGLSVAVVVPLDRASFAEPDRSPPESVQS